VVEVYCASYGTDQNEVQCSLTCIPRIQINSIDELVQLYTAGLLPGKIFVITHYDSVITHYDSVITHYDSVITHYDTVVIVLGKPMSRIMSMLVGEHIPSIKGQTDFNVRTPAPPVLKN
jgi:hypothetical protein